MKTSAVHSEDAKLQMAPMIDMVFLLVIFFMTASHLSSNQSLRMDLPTASKGVIPKERPDRWTVNILQDGSLHSGDRQVTLDDLKAAVAARAKEDPNLKVYIRADALSPHREVRRVMSALAEAGVADFIFGVYNPTAGETTE